MAAAFVIVAMAIALVFSPQRLPDETVVVLPSLDGHRGTVVVHQGAAIQVLDQPYATSRMSGGRLEKTESSAEEVGARFATALHALPQRPEAFTLYFVTGTDELTDESKGELQKVLAALAERKVPDVLVIGHTDTVGDLEWNDRLSAQRAETVKGFLVGIGIPAERIRVAGRGEREPLVPTADNVEEPRNRRVEINVR
jgi:outer membrane protein OmpA-like peptidoglycan-associated protein